MFGGALCGAALFVAFRVPAGAMIGAVLGSAMVGTCVPGKQLPRPLLTVGLVLLGCTVGVQLDVDVFGQLLGILGWVVVSVMVLLGVTLAVALLLTHRYRLDRTTALLACVPGGLSEISALAAESGARTGVVVAVHIVRVILVVLVILPVLVTAVEA